MKKILIALLFLIINIISFSQDVNDYEIKTVAVNFYNYLTGEKISIDNIKKQENHFYNGIKTYAIIVFDNNDWVVISTDKSIDPILAFSEEGSYTDSINPNAKFWFELYDYYVYNVKQNKIYEEEDENKNYPQLWKELITNDLDKYKEKSLGNDITPLITTKWGQSVSNTGNDTYAYNYYMPPDDNHNCDHTLAGCPAVAAGQILQYWKYPDCTVFNWSNMPNTLDVSNANYSQYRNEIANLLRNLADKMQDYMGNTHYYYGCSASGTNSVEAILYPIKNDFYFNNAYVITKSDYSLGDWKDLMYHELSYLRPVLYTGFSSEGGHAFVCDGYKSVLLGLGDRFHFNFGWLGDYDGFYRFTNPQGYSYDQKAIINIYPAIKCNSSLTVFNYYKYLLPPFDDMFYNSVAEYIYSSPQPITIAQNDVVRYKAYDEIVLENFETEDGADFVAEIVPCPMNCGIYTNYNLNSKFNTTSTDNLSAMEVVAGDNKIKIYPNPASDMLYIEGDFDDTNNNVQIYNLLGKVVISKRISEDKASIDISNLPEGVYIIKILSDDYSLNYQQKIIKQ